MSLLLDREAAAQNADHFRALKLLGSALYALGDFQGARHELQAALQLQPDYPDALCDLGCTFCALGQTQDAGRAFRDALAANPDHLEVCRLTSRGLRLPEHLLSVQLESCHGSLCLAVEPLVIPAAPTLS